MLECFIGFSLSLKERWMDEDNVHDRGERGQTDPSEPRRYFADKCRACGLCAKACPSDAIRGAKKTPHVIEQDKCIKCGVCLETCPEKFGAVECVSGPTAGGGVA